MIEIFRRCSSMTVAINPACRVAGLLILAAMLRAAPASAAEATATTKEHTSASTPSTQVVIKSHNKVTRERSGRATEKSASSAWVSDSWRSDTIVSIQRDHRFSYGGRNCSDGWCDKHFVLMLGVTY